MKNSKPVIKIGTRGSLLALAQSRLIQKKLTRLHPDFCFELTVIKTTGDEYQTVELFKKNQTGVFTKALEEKLLCGAIDIAIHSLKDLPTILPKKLILGAFPKRIDVRDVLISKQRLTLDSLPRGASVATGSPRRKRQLALIRPDLRLFDLRGNLDTRINRVIQKNDFSAVVVARAGLLRLKKFLKYAWPIPADKLLPAVGQAALAVEIRATDTRIKKIVRPLNDPMTETTVNAERNLLKILGGGCRVPVGVCSKIKKNKLHLQAIVYSTKTNASAASSIQGPVARWKDLSAQLAKKLFLQGAKALMVEARESH